jgi:hypothetical protein
VSKLSIIEAQQLTWASHVNIAPKHSVRAARFIYPMGSVPFRLNGKYKLRPTNVTCINNNNNTRYGKRAVASGMQITIGSISGFVSPFLYSTNTVPGYMPGYGATIGLLALGVMLYTALHFYFRDQNKRKREGSYDHLKEGKTKEEAAETGENNPRYTYTI